MRTGRSLTVCCSLLPGEGGSAWSGGVSAPRGCLLRGVCSPGGWWCLPGLGGVCLPGRGGLVPGGGSACLVRGGVWCPGGVSQHALRQTASPPVDRILDTRLWKYYFGPTSLRPVMNYTAQITVTYHYHLWRLQDEALVGSPLASCRSFTKTAIREYELLVIVSKDF